VRKAFAVFFTGEVEFALTGKDEVEITLPPEACGKVNLPRSFFSDRLIAELEATWTSTSPDPASTTESPPDESSSEAG